MAMLESFTRTRAYRRIQPLVLRGSAGSAGAPCGDRQSKAPFRGRHGRNIVGKALRGHKRLRTPSVQERHADREVLPSHLEVRAKEAPVETVGGPVQALEVLECRPRREGVLR